MKKIIPFTKEISFKTMLSKITSISLEHTLGPNENNLITGDFIIEGTYKITEASQIEENFSYKIPVEIEIDDKYDINDITLDIDDFTYKIISEDSININIDLCIDNLIEKPIENKDEIIDINFDDEEEKEETREDITLDDLFLEKIDIQELEIPPKEEQINEKKETNIQETKINNLDNIPECNSLFSSFKDDIETYKSYTVYVVKEEDTINSILLKYKINKEQLEEYNDLNDFHTGIKIIIPCDNNE